MPTLGAIRVPGTAPAFRGPTPPTRAKGTPLPTVGGAGVTAKAIRFCERKGILPAPRRAANRYRVYSEDVADILCFIRQTGGLGLTLAEIKDIIAIRPSSTASSRT